MKKELQVAFVGNPNCGKTTLFNAFTGAKLKVANWPGVTVEKKEGAMKYHDQKFRLVDLPGIYSLTSYSLEEKLTREYILESNVDVIINIVDASNLERNLYLTLQLIELGKPVILALNMMDIVEERGMEIDLHRLPEMLGIPVIPVSARKKTGLDILMHTVAHHQDKPIDHNLEHHHDAGRMPSKHIHDHHKEYPLVYSDFIEDQIDFMMEALQDKYGYIDNIRWYAIKILEKDEFVTSTYPLDLSSLKSYHKANYEELIINEKYDFIEEIIEEVLVNRSKKAAATDRIDRFLTHRYFGVPIFLGIMAIVFFLTFTIGDFLKGYFEMALEVLTTLMANLLDTMQVGEVVTSLILDGIIAGVGGILTFLPNIFILFLALAILEDSGYMSRVAYVMDGIMGKLGLSGRAFIPMLLGFGCSVPAIMSTRTLTNMSDRRKTILVTPFMSCSARLPIYVLFSQMFFGRYAMIAAYSMYFIGILVALTTAFLYEKLVKKSEEDNTLLIELPEYKSPNVRTIFIYVWEKVKEYLSKAGTTIFIASIVVWFVLNFGPTGMVEDMSLSFGAGLGKLLVPVLQPAGLGMWQVAVALISGLAAKEIVVSSFSVLYHVQNITSPAGMTSLVTMLSLQGFGHLNAYCLMLFCLLYTPCVATIGVIQRELKSAKWTAFTIVFQLAVAWLISTLVFQIGSLFA